MLIIETVLIIEKKKCIQRVFNVVVVVVLNKLIIDTVKNEHNVSHGDFKKIVHLCTTG